MPVQLRYLGTDQQNYNRQVDPQRQSDEIREGAANLGNITLRPL